MHPTNVVRQSRFNDSLFGKEQHLLPVVAVAEVITFHDEAFCNFTDRNAFPLSTWLKNQAKGIKALRKLLLGGNGNTYLVSSHPFLETFINIIYQPNLLPLFGYGNIPMWTHTLFGLTLIRHLLSALSTKFFQNFGATFKIKLDVLRALTRASYRSIKSYLPKTRFGRNKNKLKNQDILAQEFRLDIYYSSYFVEYFPNPNCGFKPFWFKNEAQLSTHLRRTCLQRIFQVFLQLIAITLYMLAEIIRSSFTGRGDPSKLCS